MIRRSLVNLESGVEAIEQLLRKEVVKVKGGDGQVCNSRRGKLEALKNISDVKTRVPCLFSNRRIW